EFIDFARQVGSVVDGGAETLFLQDRFDAVLLARNHPPARLRAVSLPAPWHLAPALLRYRYLNLITRLRLALALLDARKPARHDETFAGWLERHHQSDTARAAFWNPFLVPALNAPLEEVSAEAALFVISTAFLKNAGAGRFGYARIPLGRLAAAAAVRLDRVHLRTPVARLEFTRPGASEPDRPEVILEDGTRLSFDAVVLAVPPDKLKSLLVHPESFGVVGLDGFRTAAIVDIHLWYDLPDFGFGFAALLDSPVQWVFEKGSGYLCCSMSAADEYISRPSSELIDLCHDELSLVLPVIRSNQPLRGAVTRDREATFIPTPGLRRPGSATSQPRVTIAGAWTDTGWPATMESAVRSGRSAARATAAELMGERRPADE
ncbi:MAG: phytoene dehydrogenase, partial [Chloroflexi bacterium]